MKYNYNAILSPAPDGSEILCRVPDLPGCISSGSSVSDAIEMITDAASCWLVSAEDHNDPIPEATAQRDIDLPDGSSFAVICIDTIQYRSLTDTRAVRRNVSIPAWMAHQAQKRGINCSQVLRDGLLQLFAKD